MRINLSIFVCMLLVGSLFSCRDSQQTELYSPNKQIEVRFMIQEGLPVYSVYYKSELIIGPSPLGIELNEPFEGGFELVSIARDSSNQSWKPVYGEYENIEDHYNSVEVSLRENGSRRRLLNFQFRAYDEGAAFRYVIPDQEDSSGWKIKKEYSSFKFKEGTVAYPIYHTEETYSNEPVDLRDVRSGVFMPLTVRMSNVFASIMEADVKGYPIARLNKAGDNEIELAIYEEASLSAPFTSPWRMVLLGGNEKELIENASLILNLNPPCVIEDTSWIQAGKTISNEGSVGHETDKLKKMIEFAADNGFKYLQLDWGWYGTEVKWSDEQIDQFRQLMPAEFTGSGWEKNTVANPFGVAKGLVPYGWTERWKDFYIQVDLDMQELIAYGRSKGVGVSLYVEAGHTLPSLDMDSLFSVYESWGVAGIKPGFVNYGKQQDSEWIQNMIELAAKHHLLLCIHDARIPDGTTRTYPNLIINEGGGGQEGNHPVVQDVMLPFTRCLAGPFDYTPFIYTANKSHAHTLAFFVAYYGPAQTIRGGYTAWNAEGTKCLGGDELEFIRKVPASWDLLHVLSAKIGQHIITARQKDESWFIGGMCGENPYAETLSFDFLETGRIYSATIFMDDEKGYSDGYCRVVKKNITITSTDSIYINMVKSGGFAALLEPHVD